MPRQPTTPRGSARQRAQADTRKRLVNAAASLFAVNGSHKTTMNMVAQGAGVAVGTVYLHFPDKDALLKEIMQEALGELKRTLADAAAAGNARTASDDVRQRTEGLVRFAAASPDLAAVLFEPGHLGTEAGREVLAYLIASQAAGLASGRKKGWLRADLDTEIAARALVGSWMLVLRWWTRPERGGRGAPEEAALVAQLADLRLHGTGKR